MLLDGMRIVSFCHFPHPLRYDGQVPEFRGFALAPGADSRALLAESGFGEEEIAALLRERAVFVPAMEERRGEEDARAAG